MTAWHNKIELLAPAGNFEKLKIAIHFGADALYLGAKSFSLRNFSENFSLDGLHEAVQYAHSKGVKIYLACNVFRAVELRKPMLVAANTGFSAQIDGSGRLLQVGPRRKPGVLRAEVVPDDRMSLYLWIGDWPAFAMVVIALVGLGSRYWGSRRGTPADASTAARDSG